jgi:hypothetical protein
MVLNIIIDVTLPLFLILAGAALFGDRRRGWSYSGWDWCGGMGGTYDKCNIVRSVDVFLNETAGIIAVAVGYVSDRFLLSCLSGPLPCDLKCADSVKPESSTSDCC